MDKDFENYWNTHQKRLILNAPEKMQKELLAAGRLDTPADWICFVIPIGVGILIQSFLKMKSEILSFLITIVIMILLFALMQMLKPYISKKKTEAQVLEEIKQYYYRRYKKVGDLEKLEPWRD